MRRVKDTKARDGQDGRWAAENAVNQNRLLPGESPDTMEPEDARHWVRVYTEMLEFKRTILETMQRELSRLSPPANMEIRSIDMQLTQTQQARYKKRLEFWKARAEQLNKVGR